MMKIFKMFRKRWAKPTVAGDLGKDLLDAQKAGIVYALSGKADAIPPDLIARAPRRFWALRLYPDDSILSINLGEVLCYPRLFDLVAARGVTGNTNEDKAFVGEFTTKVFKFRNERRGPNA